MARRHSGLGRGLDALIPMREEVEKAMRSAESKEVEILFADEEDQEGSSVNDHQKDDHQKSDDQKKYLQNVSRETNRRETVKKIVKEEPEAASEPEKDFNPPLEVIPDQRKKAAEYTKPVDTAKTEDDRKPDEDPKEKKDPVTVRISEVEPNRNQPRKIFDEEKLEELSQSIKEFGMLQPILVQKRDGYYEIIAGERRWRAAIKAGLKEIPVVIRDYSDKEILELSLIENIQRENLNPIEEAQAFRRLMDEFGMGQEEMAKRVSKSRSAVANSLRLLKLESEVQKMLVDGLLSMGHARALLPLEKPEEQAAAAQKVIAQTLSVRDTEKLVRDLLKTEAGQKPVDVKPAVQEEDPSIAVIYKQIEERLQQTLHTKVQIQRKRNGHGKLLIDFYGSDDLDKIIDRLTDKG